MFTQQDLQIENTDDPEAVELLENFRRGFPFLNVVRACGDGVLTLKRRQAAAASNVRTGRCRTVRCRNSCRIQAPRRVCSRKLFEFVDDSKRSRGSTPARNIGKFAFWPELKALLLAGADGPIINHRLM